MSKKVREGLKDALHKADITELDEQRLEEVAGGVCNESCYEGCSQCCSTGSANRGGGGGGLIEYQNP
ncbi:MAG: hypothetical protein HC897_13545 [Thermoanaerobaculia bacterium]|nr:hypothetical protein [Thermoanaerobaculia bacterium]